MCNAHVKLELTYGITVFCAHKIRTYIHDFLIIHEMLRKKGKATQHNRKTKQHNTTRPRQYFSKKKAASGGTRTHDRLLARRMYDITVYTE